MTFALLGARRYRPSDSSSVRFWLWAALLSVGAILFVFLPRVPVIACVMFIGLGQIAGSQPAEADRAFRPQVFVALVLVATILISAFTIAMVSGEPKNANPLPIWARAVIGALYVLAVVVETRRFRRRHAAA